VSLESHLQRLAEDLTPPSDAQQRIQKRIEARLATPALLLEVQKALTPSQQQKACIWERIAEKVDMQHTAAFLDRLRELLTPPQDLGITLQSFVLPRMVPAHVVVRQRTVKWVAAFALFLLVVQAVPQLFLAPSTVAEGAVTLLPTRGEVTISVGGLWQPVTGEITLEPGMLLRTHDGEASLLLRDDGVVRLDAQTTIEVESLADPADTEAILGPTVTLITGQLWVQGLIPPSLSGITVQTTHGLVEVNEGSVSVTEDREVEVKVWDRRAQVIQAENFLYLVAGERVRLFEDEPLFVKKIPEEEFETDWVTQNLQRDAVHRRSIAQMQQERRAARAGILPTSPLYPVKRIAEKVDVLLTLGEEARTQKLLEHANVRLDEAAALLAEGEVEAMRIPLEDYRDSLLAVAAGSGGNLLVQELLAQSLAEQTGEVAAVLPDDEAYLIKEAILEASAAVPDGTVSASDVQGILLVDTISALIAKVDEEGTADVEIWHDLQEQLDFIDDEESSLRPEVRKEAQVLLS